MEALAEMGGQGPLRILTAWKHEVSLERTAYRVLESTSPTSAEMFPVLSRQQTHISGNTVNRYEWSYSPATTTDSHNGMKVVDDFTLFVFRFFFISVVLFSIS